MILWMATRNPAPVENSGLSHDFLGFQHLSTIRLVVQDFAGPPEKSGDDHHPRVMGTIRESWGDGRFGTGCGCCVVYVV